MNKMWSYQHINLLPDEEPTTAKYTDIYSWIKGTYQALKKLMGIYVWLLETISHIQFVQKFSNATANHL
jgi:hypothetical protein